MSDSEKVSQVENALRSQRDSWKEISERVAGISNRELPPQSPSRILLFGVGSSYHAARLCAAAIHRDRNTVRKQVIACPSTHVGREVFPSSQDWCFAFTHRGATPATIAAMEACDHAGAFTICVSGKGAAQPASARFALETVALEKVEPHTSAVTGAICAVTSMLMGRRAVEEWDALHSIGDPSLELLRERAGRGPAAIIGEWEGEWIAREGALKLMEMARLPVRAFGSEEFFHGPQHSFEPGARIWHVSMPKDPREEEIRAAHQIRVFGASALAWIPALVELQWLALATALNLGVNPDLKPA